MAGSADDLCPVVPHHVDDPTHVPYFGSLVSPDAHPCGTHPHYHRRYGLLGICIEASWSFLRDDSGSHFRRVIALGIPQSAVQVELTCTLHPPRCPGGLSALWHLCLGCSSGDGHLDLATDYERGECSQYICCNPLCGCHSIALLSFRVPPDQPHQHLLDRTTAFPCDERASHLLYTVLPPPLVLHRDGCLLSPHARCEVVCH